MSAGNGGGRGPLERLGGAHELPPIVDDTPEGLEWAELKTGLRCAGCGERITQGFEFVKLQVLRDPVSGARQALRSTMTTCVRPECDYVLQVARESVAVRKIEVQFMDDERWAGLLNDPSAS